MKTEKITKRMIADIICNERASNFFMRHILWLVSQPPNIITLPDCQWQYQLSLLSDSILGFVHEIFIYSLVFSLEGRAWQEPEPSYVTGMALAHCILGKFLGVVCHCFPPPLDVSSQLPPSVTTWEILAEKGGTVGEKDVLSKFRVPYRKSTIWDRRLYFPSEGRRGEDFSALKIRRLGPGLKTQTWVLKASTLPLDHRSRFTRYVLY